MREVLKFLGGLTLGLAAALLIAFNALLLWVATGPRSLDALTPYIAASLTPKDSRYNIKIGQTWLIWEGWQHPLDIQLKQVEVLTKEGQVFSRFPAISLGLDVLSLPLGRILPRSLTVTHPIISLYQNDDRSISFGIGGQEETPPDTAAEEPSAPFAAVMALLLHPEDSGSLRKLHGVTIVDADVSVGNHKGVFFKASGVNLLFRRNWKGNVQIAANAKIAYGNYRSLIDAHLHVPRHSQIVDGSVVVNQLMPGTVAALFSSDKLLSAVKLPVSGKVDVSLDMTDGLRTLSFMLDGGKGDIESDRLAAPLPVTTLHAEGSLTGNANTVNIRKLSADLDGMRIEAAGGSESTPAGLAVHGDLSLKNVPAARVALLWPPALSPESRAWVTGNITEGLVPQANAHIAIAPGDLAKPVLPQGDIAATLDLRGAKIRYLPDHPEIHNVNGILHIDALTLQADIASGDYMQDTKLTGGKLTIPDLNADNPYIKLDFDAQAPAKDVVKILSLPRLDHAARLGLNADTAQGSVKGNVMLGFNFFAPHDANGNPVEADVDYDVKAELKGVTQPGFMGKFDVKNADGNLNVNKTGVEFKGKGEVNGASASDADVKYLFKPDNGFDTFIDVTASAPVASFSRFGYPQFPFIQGVVGVKAALKQGDNAENAQVNMDLSHAAVSFPDYGWIKPDGQPAAFEFTEEKKEGAVSIPAFHVTGRDMDSKGSIELSKDLSQIRRMTFAPLRFGATDIDRFLYEVIDGGWRIEASGKSADMTAWMAPNDKKGPGFSFAHFPAFQLKAQIGTLILGGRERRFSHFEASADCSAALCQSAYAGGNTPDGKPFVFRIYRNGNGPRQLAVHADNGGAFLRSATIFDGMEGGELTLTGAYDDKELKGVLDIGPHTIKGAPILARILSVASLTGFIDTLQGNGISFDKLHAPFTLHGDVITLEDTKTHGPAIGLTASGTITFPARTLDIEGTLVPSYTLNHVLGNVPLVGSVLTGGEGQGIFAARYHITGTDRNPDVTVNPLSMLTPGFLRGVFDIFDSPKKREE